MKKGFQIILLISLVLTASAQTSPDSLKQVLENAQTDSIRFDALYSLTAYYINRDLSQSVDYGEQAMTQIRHFGGILFASCRCQDMNPRASRKLCHGLFFHGPALR